MKRSKLAQIALYIILGLILFFVVGIGFYFVSNIKKEKFETVTEEVQEISFEVHSIKSYVDTCLKDSSIISAYKLGLQGGYYVLPLETLDTYYITLPYYYNKGQNLIPSREAIEKGLAQFINNELRNCVDFSAFKEQGFNISNEEFTIKASILNNKVIIDLNFPLKIKKEKSIQELFKFSYELQVRLGHIYEISKELINKITKEPYYIDLTFLLSKDLDISVIHYDECNDLYIIVDNYSTNVGLSDYLYLFATRLEEKYCKFEINETTEQIIGPPIENNLPVLDLISYAATYINETFIYNVSAFDIDNDKLFFLDDTDLFYIHPLLGTIEFTPKIGQEGLHKINITVVDINGGYKSQWFYLEIK